MYRFAIYISNHGYGHATRMAALAQALNDFGIYTFICTDRPDFLFQYLDPECYTYRKCSLDGGVKHQENLVADLVATKEMLLGLFSQREDLVHQEAIWLRENKIDLVIADIPYFIIEAAGYAQIPAFGISNFDWVFIYGELFKDVPDLKLIINAIYGLYRRLDKCYLPALGTALSVPGFRNPESCGILVRSSQADTKILHKNILLIMFGGEGEMSVDFPQICAAWEGEVLSINSSVQASNHRLIPRDADFSALMQQASLVLCKPGYSTFAEIRQAGVPAYYIPRRNYPEERVLIEGVQDCANLREVCILPENEQEWRELFANKPERGSGEEAANEQIAGLILRDYLQLKHPKARLLSVFDMGSNNLNYCIFDQDKRKLLHRVWITTSLALNTRDNLLSFNQLDDIPALHKLLVSDAQIPSEKRLLATGIMRRALNAQELLDKLSSAWKLEAKIISSKAEMRYAWYAASSHLAKGLKALVIDIGGSSTELVWRAETGAFHGQSCEIGLVSLAQSQEPQCLMQEAVESIAVQGFELIITVGLTATILAKIATGKSWWELWNLGAMLLSIQELNELRERLGKEAEASKSESDPAAFRLYTMLLATDFLILILDRFGSKEIMVSNDGISIGYARYKTRNRLARL